MGGSILTAAEVGIEKRECNFSPTLVALPSPYFFQLLLYTCV